MDDNGSENEEHFSHAGTADGHFLLAFFCEALMEFLKYGNFWNAWNGIKVQDLSKSAGRTSAYERGMNTCS